MISIDEIRSSLPNVYKFAIKTPLVRCYALSNEYVDVYLKLENIQPIGSFKIRGAANAMQHIPIAELSNGVFTASAGNMAQGLAFCAKSVGVQCTVICPDTAPQTKIDAVERLNAKVVKVPFDDWWNTFKTRSFPGVNARFVHAFDDDHVMAGNGTIGLEIVEQLPDVDCVLVPVGGGGLVCGIASALRQLKPDCKVYACEVATSAPFDAAFRNGVPTKIAHQNTFVDGIGSAVCFDSMFQRAKVSQRDSFSLVN